MALHKKCLSFFLPMISSTLLYAQASTTAEPPSYFLNAGVFFSPSMSDTYFSPALDAEVGLWKTNKRNFFSWGASTEVWYFTSVKYEMNNPIIRNNTDGFLNLNGMFFYENKLITPYIAPSFSLASDFKKIGISGGLAIGLSHQTTDRLQTMILTKYVKFSNELNYLDTYFFMVCLSLKLSE